MLVLPVNSSDVESVFSGTQLSNVKREMGKDFVFDDICRDILCHQKGIHIQKSGKKKPNIKRNAINEIKIMN